MINYICESCGTPFDEPLEKKTMMFQIDGFPRYEIEQYCPICCSYRFTPADYCGCGEAKEKRERICKKCKSELLNAFNEFCDGLTEDEEEQLDDWLDGESVKDRKRWHYA